MIDFADEKLEKAEFVPHGKEGASTALVTELLDKRVDVVLKGLRVSYILPTYRLALHILQAQVDVANSFRRDAHVCLFEGMSTRKLEADCSHPSYGYHLSFWNLHKS